MAAQQHRANIHRQGNTVGDRSILREICWCGRKATHTARVTAKGDMVREGAQVSIGGNDMYLSLCRRHFMKGQLQADTGENNKDKAAA